MELDENEYLAHYGTPRHSGRYPWGSGDNVVIYKNKGFLDFVKQLKNEGMTESQIAQGFGMKVSELRAAHSIESNAHRQSRINMAQRLKDKGLSNTAIAARMGVSESNIRSWLASGAQDKADVLTATANKLKSEVGGRDFVDVSKGTEAWIGVSRTRLDTAVEVLKQQGYEVFRIKERQTTSGHDTNVLVLAPPGTQFKDVIMNKDRIKQIGGKSNDGGRTYPKIHEPIQIDPKRVQVIYGPDGGAKADGVLYVRPGVEDISLGGSRYAQVRVAVGPDHFLKGMAIYKDDLPDGVDVQFNTNKNSTGNKLDAMKKNSEEKGFMENGPHVLLKSVRNQVVADIGKPTEHVTSAMNIVNEEGKWENWSHELSSQMLSKQSPKLIKSQLDMTYERRQNQFDTINSLTNPTVRKKMLEDFANDVDGSASHLEAAALPRTGTHVILPLNSIAPNKIYAPNFDNGETVVLIRHPHAGKFEIPELVVDNNNRQGKKLLGDSRDAVGIHHSVAEKLSGADFDGDTVLVIPNKKGLVQHEGSLEGLKNFDTKRAFPAYPGMKPISSATKQLEMGKVSNLITDMSIQGASHKELAAAVRHSMVVIDAEKHNLDYKQSYVDNGIRNLQKKYQSGGASTLISRAGAKDRIPQRKPRTRALGGPVDLTTGAKAWEPTNKLNKNGDPITESIRRLANTPDARTLMSTEVGTRVERLYAEHSNKLKTLANRARLVSVHTPNSKYSPTAKKVYKSEVDSLNSKHAIAVRNAPLERMANRIANAQMQAVKQANPEMDKDTEKKLRSQALTQARIRTGAYKTRVEITPKEWEAIQAGAISSSKLTQILKDADMSVVRDLAMPKSKVLMTASKTDRAKQMLESGFTRAQVADQLGVSLSTLDDATT